MAAPMPVTTVRFQHTAARRRLGRADQSAGAQLSFNTQPPEGGWVLKGFNLFVDGEFQHTAARRRLVSALLFGSPIILCFNTQPPEGGWIFNTAQILLTDGFNTQPPEGGWYRKP